MKLISSAKLLIRHAASTGTWPISVDDGTEFLFNLSGDERERADLKSIEPARLNSLRSASEKWNGQMLGYPEKSYSEDMKGKFADHI